jgi:hypothetical protein
MTATGTIPMIRHGCSHITVTHHVMVHPLVHVVVHVLMVIHFFSYNAHVVWYRQMKSVPVEQIVVVRFHQGTELV